MWGEGFWITLLIFECSSAIIRKQRTGGSYDWWSRGRTGMPLLACNSLGVRPDYELLRLSYKQIST